MNDAACKPHLTELDALRAEQDQVDREIVAALGKRVALRRKISALRMGNNMPTIDEARMQVVLNQVAQYATDYDVPPEMARNVFQVLIDWSHRLDWQWREEKRG